MRQSFPRGLSSLAVLVVADFFQPVHRLAVERFLNGDMRHGRRRRGTVPMLFAGRDRDHIAGMDFLNRTALLLYPSETGGDDQSLPKRMGVPGCSGAGFEGDTGARSTSRGVWLEQWINAHCAGKPVGRSLAGWLRANSFDFHTDLFCVGYMGFDLGAENRRGGERRAGNPKKAASGNGHSLRIAESRLLAPRSNRLAVRSFGLKIPEPGKISTSSFLLTFVDSARALSPRPLNSFANALRLNLRRSSG